MRMRDGRLQLVDCKMEDELDSQRRDKLPKEVEELYLDNVGCSSISGITDEYVNLKKLSLVNNGLTSLKGLPSLPNLQWLSLSDNKLVGDLESVCSQCPQVSHLGLAGNRINGLDELKPLAKLEKLTSLDLYNCPVTLVKSYREQIFEFLPKLEILDGINAKGEEATQSDNEEEEEEEEGAEDSGVSDEEVGLDYLTKDIGSESSDEDFDPAYHGDLSDEDDSVDSEDEAAAGPSAKKPRLAPASEQPASDSSDSD